jgi:nucleotide-binding universal stress UspA family protein
VVQGDPAIIDALVAQVWPEEANHSLHLLACAQAGPAANDVETYAQAIGDLLGAQVSHFHSSTTTGVALDILVKEVRRASYDLAVLGEDQLMIERLLLGWADRKAAERVPTSLLVTPRPRWPLKRMLLIIRGEEMDDVAVDWIVRLARPSGAAVTALTIVPPIPAMYHGMARMQQGLAALLDGDSALGQQMHRAAQRLADWEIKSTLRLCQGPLDLVIHREMAEGDYDLIVVTAERHHRWLRWLLGELVGSLLRWADRPVLIAKPAIA